MGGDELDDGADDAGAPGTGAQVHARGLDLVLQELVELPAQLSDQLSHLGREPGSPESRVVWTRDHPPVTRPCTSHKASVRDLGPKSPRPTSVPCSGLDISVVMVLVEPQRVSAGFGSSAVMGTPPPPLGLWPPHLFGGRREADPAIIQGDQELALLQSDIDLATPKQ